MARLARAGGGLVPDLGLYALSALFAGLTAATSTLPPHRAWGRVAVFGYAAAGIATLVLLALRRRDGGGTVPRGAAPPGPRRTAGRTVLLSRTVLAGLAWLATAGVPLVVQSMQRAGGAVDRAQEEVVVVEHGGQRLLDTGTPYLSRAAIAALPADERLIGYLPYQPGMALFGLPRAIWGTAWWTDARVAFAVVTAAALVAALALLRAGGADAWALIVAGQAVTVLPICGLTMAVGGDDLPVLALCLLGLGLAARSGGTGRPVASGVAVGAASALKLFAWPVAAVLLGYALTGGRRRGLAYGLPAFGIPLAVLVPAFAVDADATVENVLRYPLGRGVMASPAQSPFPGQLIASGLPGGRAIAAALLVVAAVVAAGWLVRRPPRDAGTAALVCAAGLLAAILLMPSTRFGYLLYPAGYALWVPALRSANRPVRVASAAHKA
jgi:hypothetical protein